MTQAAHELSPSRCQARLRRRATQPIRVGPDIFDIAATAAGRAFFAKLLDALGVMPDSPFLAMDPALRERLTVGRPIDQRPSVSMPDLDDDPAKTA